MSLSIAVTGSGRSGSWRIRGEQLGRAIGAEIITSPIGVNLDRFDIVISVKRPVVPDHSGSVYDIVDAWPQPTGNKWIRADIIRYMKDKAAGFGSLVCATQTMADDLGGFFLPHHYRPNIKESQCPPHVKRVGYEGSRRYLCEWEPVIMAECAARGWEWVPDADLTEEPCDILIALRGAEWQGYGTNNWKSGVKLSNAIGSLTPLICLPERGYLEYGLPVWTVNGISDIAKAFDALAEHRTRDMMARAYMAAKPDYSLKSIAERYLAWLATRY